MPSEIKLPPINEQKIGFLYFLERLPISSAVFSGWVIDWGVKIINKESTLLDSMTIWAAL